MSTRNEVELARDEAIKAHESIKAELRTAIEEERGALRKEIARLNQQAFEQDRANVRLAAERDRYRAALLEELRLAKEGLEYCRDNDLDDDGLQECVDRITAALADNEWTPPVCTRQSSVSKMSDENPADEDTSGCAALDPADDGRNGFIETDGEREGGI